MSPAPALRPGPALRTARLLSLLLAALMVVESAIGLLVPDLYPEDPWAVAAFRGNDLVTLVLASPLLAGATLAARRGSAGTAAALWLGMLHYGVYNFAYYAFGAAFNAVFLLHVASLVLSLSALVLLLASVDAAASGAPRDLPGPWPTRIVAGFTTLVGAALVLAWGGMSLRFAITGELPDDVMPASAVHLVYAIDLSLLAPAFLVAGVALWRGAAWGRLLAVAINLSGAVYLTVLEVVGGFQADAGIAGKTWLSPVGLLAPPLCLAAALTLLRPTPGSTATDR